jgi:hypothetical protein
MTIEKITQNYSFSKEGKDYILNLGEIKRGDDTTTVLHFKDVKGLTVSATCGCTVADRTELEDGSVKYSVKYKNCDSSFSKVLNCQNNKENFKIKIKGTCR